MAIANWSKIKENIVAIISGAVSGALVFITDGFGAIDPAAVFGSGEWAMIGGAAVSFVVKGLVWVKKEIGV